MTDRREGTEWVGVLTFHQIKFPTLSFTNTKSRKDKDGAPSSS